MNVIELEAFWRKVACELVEVWRKILANKKWSDLTQEQLGKLLFESGVEIGKVMTRELWEGVLFDVAAFMREWLSDCRTRQSSKARHGGDARWRRCRRPGIVVRGKSSWQTRLENSAGNGEGIV